MSEVLEVPFDNSPNSVRIEDRVPVALPADRDPFGMNLAPLREKAANEAPAASGSDPRVLKSLDEIGHRLDRIEKALFQLLLK